MANKRFTKIAALLLLSTIGLTACDSEVKALPSNYADDKIVNFEDNADIYNNLASVFYDEIHDGALASDVLEEVLYQYAQAMFGRYNKVSGKNYDSAKEMTLKEVVAYTKSTDAAAKEKVNAFVKSHKAYWSVNAMGERVDDDNNVVANDANASQREIARIQKKWDSIEERIAEAMYTKISSGSYSYRNRFSETKFLASLKFDGKKVISYDADGIIVHEDVLLTPNVEPKDVFSAEGFLTRANYQGNAGLDEDETASEIHYIEKEIVPTIYRSLLTEQYLIDETYNSLGRSYARKINVITISNNDDYDKAAPYLMNELINDINDSSKTVDLDTFKTYANVWKGHNLSSAEKAIADTLVASGAYANGVSKEGENFYKGTQYGNMMEKYDKIDKDPLLTDTAIESEFTGSNAYSKEVGKQMKADEIDLKDYTTTGWFTKSAGVDGLPSSITTRLFNVSVANAIDNEETVDRSSTDFNADKENNYVAKINNKYYLKTGSAEQGDEKNDILFYDGDSKTYYVVQIEEAVNSIKFSRTSDKNYANIKNDGGKGNEIMEEYVNSVLKIVAKSDSNETLSKKHWLGEMNLEYYDQVVYDYFKANFPDLFE